MKCLPIQEKQTEKGGRRQKKKKWGWRTGLPSAAAIGSKGDGATIEGENSTSKKKNSTEPISKGGKKKVSAKGIQKGTSGKQREHARWHAGEKNVPEKKRKKT